MKTPNWVEREFDYSIENHESISDWLSGLESNPNYEYIGVESVAYMGGGHFLVLVWVQPKEERDE